MSTKVAEPLFDSLPRAADLDSADLKERNLLVSKSADSYSRSRFNAMKFGIHREGPIPCLGAERCQHRYCEDAFTPPSDGSACPWEQEYARRLEEEFRQRYDLLTITPDVDDYEDLVSEFVNIYLQRSRAMSRMNWGWNYQADDGRLRPEAYHEFEIADLYLDRLTRREQRLMETLDDGLQRMRERAERLRPHLHVFEAFVAGKKAANDAAQTPPQPIWDEFVDES